MKLRLPIAVPLLLLLLFPTAAWADVELPGFYGDHMVLQREKPIVLRGWAEPGEEVSVRIAGHTARATADEEGRFAAELPALRAGGPYKLVVRGKNVQAFRDVLVGDVWLCSGQSNMAWRVAASQDAKAEIAVAKDPGIRHLLVPRSPAGSPRADLAAPWRVCSPETTGAFTACGYFMARELRRELGVPIGLVNASWGGTRIEPWIPREGYELVPSLSKALPGIDAAAAAAPKNHQQPTVLHNGMVAPLVRFGLRGVIWYQGESNLRDGESYYHKMNALVRGWRRLWEEPELPFHFVQIAPYAYGNSAPDILPALQEAQARAAADLPATAMVVTNDIGTVEDIHPRNKQEVGRRLALLALRYAHGKDVVAEGPVFDVLEREGGRLRLFFDHADGGLHTRDGKPPSHFEIAGEDGIFVPAEATIDGDTVVVSAEGVAEPVAVRFAWHKLAEPNLVNRAGLPAGAFRAALPEGK